MCRNIKTLHNFDPAAFNRAVDQVTEVVHDLLATLVTNAPPRDREISKARSAERYGGSGA